MKKKKKKSEAIEHQRLHLLITQSRNYPIGYMSCLFSQKAWICSTRLKSHSSIVHATQLMPAIVSWQAPQSNPWSIVLDKSVTLNSAWQPSTMGFLGKELISMDYNRRIMTISKNNAQTCIIGGFEKRPMLCPVLR